MSQHTPDAWIERSDEEGDPEFWTVECPMCNRVGDPEKVNDAGLCPGCAKKPVGLVAVLEEIRKRNS